MSSESTDFLSENFNSRAISESLNSLISNTDIVYFETESNGSLLTISSNINSIVGSSIAIKKGTPVTSVFSFLSNDSNSPEELIGKHKVRILLPGKRNIYGELILEPNSDDSKGYNGFFIKESRDKIISSSLLEISKKVAESDSLESLFTVIKEQLGNFIDTSNFAVGLYDEQNNTVSFPYFVDEKNSEFSILNVSTSDAISTRVIKSGSSVFLNSDDVKQYYETLTNRRSDVPCKIWAGVPLKIKERILGLIVVQSYKNENAFDKEDVDILEGISGQIAMFIEKVKTDELLREQQQRIELITKNVGELLAIYSLKNKITYVSPASKELFGYSPEQLALLTPDKLIHPDDLIIVKEKYITSIKQKSFFELEFRIKRSDGVYIWVLTRGQPIYDDIGNLTQIVTSTRDITDRINSREKLRSSEEKYRQLIQNINEVIFTTDVEGIITFVSPSIHALLGFESDEWKNTKLSLYIHPDDLNTFHADFMCLMNGNKAITELRMFHNSGEHRYIRISWNSNTSASEAPAITGILTDITKQKKYEEALRASEANYKTIFDNNGNATVILSNELEIILANQECEKLTGYTVSELLHEVTLNQILHHEEREKLLTYHKKRITNPESVPSDYETKIVSKDGSTKFVRIYVSVIPGTKNRVVSLLDITTQKNDALELEQAIEKAEHSDRLKSEFLAQMSHEIRVPIGALMSYVNIIKYELGKDVSKTLSRAFAVIDENSRRIIRTVDLILNVAEIQSGSFSPYIKKFDLYKEILHKLYLEFKKVAAIKNLTFAINLETEDTLVQGDEYSIRHILDNIIDNAIKYTPKGKIEVTVSKAEGDSLKILISDTGIGISETYLPELFSAFSQEEQGYARKFEGNGLGMALVKAYCDLNGISIDVKSKKGKGTIFTLLIKQN